MRQWGYDIPRLPIARLLMLPALVLTAGYGTRLEPLTRLIAKPAVPLAGRTLIERVLASLQRQDISDVVLNLHHRPETIAAVVGDGAHLGLRVRYSWEQPLLGSAGGPRHALPLLDSDTLLIVNGDTLCDVSLASILAAHRASNSVATMALVPNPAPDRYNTVVLDEHDRVVRFVPKGSGTSGWHFVGIQVVRRSVFEQLRDGESVETVAGIYADLVRKEPGCIGGWRLPASTVFLDVGTPRDYLETAIGLSTDATGNAIEAGSVIDPTARLFSTVVWSGVTIGPRVMLSRCVVAGDVALPADFTAEDAVIVPPDAVEPGDGVEIESGVAVFGLRYT
jgi:mannose-1-phosphate guanylyltransferase